MSREKNTPRYYLFPSLGSLLFIIMLLMGLSSIQSYDLFWHLATGEFIVNNWAIPDSDPFSFTMQGEPWIAHEWLSDLIFYVVYSLDRVDYSGIILLKGLIIALTYRLLFAGIRKRLGALMSFIVVFWSAVLGYEVWSERPQIFSLLLFVVLLRMLDGDDRLGNKKLLWVPLLMALWANLHGGWIYGAMLVVFYVLCESWRVFSQKSNNSVLNRLRHPGVLLFGCGIATMISPYGIRNTLYPLQYLGETAHKLYLTEWWSPSFPEEWALLISMIGIFVILSFRRYKGGLFPFIILLASLMLTLDSIRHIGILGLCLAWWLSRVIKGFGSASPKARLTARITKMLDNIERNESALRSGFWETICILIVILCYVFSCPLKGIMLPGGIERGLVPEDGIRFINEQLEPEARILNFYAWGGEIIWMTEHKVFIDGRADLYSDKLLPNYMRIMGVHQGWEELLDDYEVTHIFIPKECTLSDVLGYHPSWRIIYAGEHSILYARADPGPMNGSLMGEN